MRQVSDSDANGGPAGAILVTGAAGFIGREVVRAFAAAGSPPRALVRGRGGHGRIGAHCSDIHRGGLGRDDAALAGIGTVVHLAYDLRASGAANLQALERLLESMERQGVRRLVHASSIVVHDGWPNQDLTETAPITPTGETDSYRGAKIAMEERIAQAVAAGRLDMAVLLRPTLVYGRGSRMWTQAVADHLRAGPVILPAPPAGHPPDRPFGLCHLCHVEDLAKATLAATQRWPRGLHAVLLSDPDPPRWDTYYRLHAEILGRGEVRILPYEDLAARLPPVPDGPADLGPGLAARLSAALRRVVGNRAVDALGARLRRAGQGGGPLYPDRFLLELYAATGRIDVGLAERELGFRPAKPPAARIADMAAGLLGRV